MKKYILLTIIRRFGTGLYGDGTPYIQQAAFNDDGTENFINIGGTEGAIYDGYTDYYYSELSISRKGIASSGTDAQNATAKDLAGFLTSAKNNGGYYIARYEASYGGGYISSGINDEEKYENAKPLSKESTSHGYVMSYNEGNLWTHISQLQASKVSRNMYKWKLDAKGNSVGVESDLMNSYAWDTAIVYISQMKDEYANFANFQNHTDYDTDSVDNTDLIDTGTNQKDKFCNIYDMVANCSEWTTEYYYSSDFGYSFPCVNRGCSWQGGIMASRSGDDAVEGYNSITFRPICYID